MINELIFLVNYLTISIQVNGGGEVNPTLVGWANVSFHVTGILVDFLMGFWTTKRGSIEPLLLSLLFFGVGNFMYGYAQACGPHGVTVIIGKGRVGIYGVPGLGISGVPTFCNISFFGIKFGGKKNRLGGEDF